MTVDPGWRASSFATRRSWQRPLDASKASEEVASPGGRPATRHPKPSNSRYPNLGPAPCHDDFRAAWRIQKETNDGALFVLPSQLNGAEYPSHNSVTPQQPVMGDEHDDDADDGDSGDDADDSADGGEMYDD